MTFAYPYLLYLLIVPALLLVLAYVAGRSRSRKWEQLVAPELRKELVSPPNHARRLTALLTGMLGLSLLIAAMARPQWGEREVQEFSRGRNLLIAIDVSRSMLTRDVQPSRLEQARTAAFDLLDALPEDKIGLIVFSGEASLVVPLTHDHNAIRETLEQANYGWINYGGTNFNDVISLALKTLGRTEGTSALVLISDGETTEPLTPSLAEKAKESKLIVIAAGVGTASGDTIPDKTSPDGFFRDRSGKMVVSKLDSASLELLAKETGGQYATISSGSALNQMVREISKKLDEKENASSTRKIAMERYAPFLGSGLFLTALALMLSAQWANRTAKSRTAAFALLFSLGLPFAQSRADTTAPIAPDAVPSRTLPIPEDLPLEMKSWLAFQNGYNDFNHGKFAEAASAFSRALLSEDKKVQTEAHYNLANSLVEKNLKTLKSKEAEKIFSDEKALNAMQDSLNEAIRHYEDTLKENESHLNAKENKKIVEEIIKKLKEEKQKQDQQKKDQNKDDQQKQDQQKNDQNKDGQQKQDQQKNDQNKDGQQGQDPQKNDQNKDGQQGQDPQKNDQNKDGQQGQDQQKNDQNKDGQQGQDQQKNDQNKDGQQPQPTNQTGEQAKADNSSGTPGEQGDVEGSRVPVGEEGEHSPKDTPEEQALKILKERSDLEKGNPMPQYRIRNNPAKDW